MKNIDAITALAALAQENRLDVFRLLVQAGPEGMPAGEVADALDLSPNNLTFHFDRLREAGLVTVRREGARCPGRSRQRPNRLPHRQLLPRGGLRPDSRQAYASEAVQSV